MCILSSSAELNKLISEDFSNQLNQAKITHKLTSCEFLNCRKQLVKLCERVLKNISSPTALIIDDFHLDDSQDHCLSSYFTELYKSNHLYDFEGGYWPSRVNSMIATCQYPVIESSGCFFDAKPVLTRLVTNFSMIVASPPSKPF